MGGRTLVLLVLTGGRPRPAHGASHASRPADGRRGAERRRPRSGGPRRGRGPARRLARRPRDARLVTLVGAVVATVALGAARADLAPPARLPRPRRAARGAGGRRRGAGGRPRPGPDAASPPSRCWASAASGSSCRARRCGSRRWCGRLGLALPGRRTGWTRRARPDARAHLWGHGAIWPLVAAVALAATAAHIVGLGRIPALSRVLRRLAARHLRRRPRRPRQLR